MTLNVLREMKAEMFFIFEHKADYSIPMYFILWLKRKPVFFFVHDMQQCAAMKTRSKIALHICRAFVRVGEFYPVFIGLNDAGLDEGLRFLPEKTVTIPHPHHLAELPAPARPGRLPGARLRVGIIETMRKEKSIDRLVEILRKLQEPLGFQLVIGAPLWKNPKWMSDPDLEVVDTTTEAQFSTFLQSSDIFVVDFIKAEYFFRPSGAVVDAGMNGCYVICPDFPVFRAQIDTPVSIGSTFPGVEEIPSVLEKAIKKLRSEKIDFETWRNYHRVESIAGQLKAFLQKRETAKKA